VTARLPDARRTGFVSLVGAGPGDPDLLTAAALDRLRRADLVLYDALVPPALALLAGHAQRFCVGKRAGRPLVNQETVNALMIRAARRGQRVVRLKAGDPFVLGRGGEEALALQAAGVAFEVVPGVTAAIAAPGLAGIPVTHRGLASAFVVVSGHDPEAYGPILDGLPPNGLTIVALMALGASRAIGQRLLAKGWKGLTPAAVITAASTDRSSCWRGTLSELAAGPAAVADALGQVDPGTLVIGEVVALAAVLGGQAAGHLPSAGVGS
jgi:uroporphyrin-III C-methyltransferase